MPKQAVIGQFEQIVATAIVELDDRGSSRTEGWRGGAVALAILYVLGLQNPTGRVPRFS